MASLHDVPELSQSHLANELAQTVKDGKRSDVETQAIVTAMLSTVTSLLQSNPNPKEFPRLITGSLTIIPHTSPIPSTDTQDFLRILAKQSLDAAISLTRSSILAHASESDEFGDIAFWLGQLEEPTADVILAKLGLGSLGKASNPTILGNPVPSSITRLQDSERLQELPSVSQLSMQLYTLEDLFEFQIASKDPSVVIYVLAGKREEEWCGLIGAGVVSDLE